MGTGHTVFQFDPPGLESEQGRMLSDAEHRARKTLTSYNGRVFPKTFYAEAGQRRTLLADGTGGLWEYFHDVKVELMIPEGRRLAIQVVGYQVEASPINSCDGFSILRPRVGVALDGQHPVTGAGIGAYALWRTSSLTSPGWFSTTGTFEYSSTFAQEARLEPAYLGQSCYIDPLAGVFGIDGYDTKVTLTAIGSFGSTSFGNNSSCAGNDDKVHIEGLRMWVHQM